MPGYTLSRQVPPTAAARSKMVISLTPARNKSRATPIPDSPAPMITTS
ncbi:Uncharacterised protein [Mycobacteroides abscessus subsp. abscessus]|nr:Uncharacterised protein [Mycobacteroides abscessus subsp. abscessus]SKU57431.1 Uncharacterised protein [Mycobacteroides abscessus subsp. abscessus]